MLQIFCDFLALGGRDLVCRAEVRKEGLPIGEAQAGLTGCLGRSLCVEIQIPAIQACQRWVNN